MGNAKTDTINGWTSVRSMVGLVYDQEFFFSFVRCMELASLALI
jgi:hypothetical protein